MNSYLTIRPRESLKKTEMLKIIENYCLKLKILFRKAVSAFGLFACGFSSFSQFWPGIAGSSTPKAPCRELVGKFECTKSDNIKKLFSGGTNP